MKVFVIHYKKLVERKVRLIELFKQHNITDYEFVEIDRDDVLQGGYDISMFKEGYHSYQIAIALSHFHAYQQIRDHHDWALILEDDVIFSPDFNDKLALYRSQLPDDYDMMFIGNGCNLHVEAHKLIDKQYVYKKPVHPMGWGNAGATRCTDSYIMTKKCAQKVCEYIRTLPYKVEIPVDWWLNVASTDCDLKVYWAEPTIVSQGTQAGLYQTSY